MSSSPHTRAHVLLITGAVGVGKSDASYHLFARQWRAGTPSARLDLDELGMCHPAPEDDQDNHRVKAEILGAVWPVFRDRSTERLVLAGGVLTAAEAQLYRAQIPDADWTVCRLRAGDDERRVRTVNRTASLGTPAAETEFWLRVGRDEEAVLDAADFVDVTFDTDGRDRQQVVDLIAQAIGW